MIAISNYYRVALFDRNIKLVQFVTFGCRYMLQLFTSVSKMALLLLTLTPSSDTSSSLAKSVLGAPEKSLLEAPEAALVGEELYILAIFILLALALGERLQLPVPPSWLRVVALSLE